MIIKMDNYNSRTGLRNKANFSKQFRCNTLTCVLEKPKEIVNICSVIRNIDTLGVGKLYIIDSKNVFPNSREEYIKNKTITTLCCSANKYVYVKKFNSTQDCINYLQQNNYDSISTSPHKQPNKDNFDLNDGNYTQKKLAVWFGNESHGLTQEAINHSKFCIQIQSCGIIESMNLATSTGIILHTTVSQRRNFISNKRIKI